MRARLAIPILFAVSLTLLPTTTHSAPPPKTGTSCSKAGITKIYQNKKYTCLKSGQKLIWGKGMEVKNAQPTPATTPTSTPTLSPTPSPSPIPTLTPTPAPAPSTIVKPATPPSPPTNWSDLIQNAEGISYWAWKKTAEKIEISTSKLGDIEFSISPNGIPDNPNPLAALNLVSRFSANFEEPKKVIFIYAGEKDIEWGQQQIDQFCAERTCGYDVSGEAKKACNVPVTPCWGGLALRNQRSNIPMIYATASDWGKNDPGHTSGTLEAHEYFHTIQSLLLKNAGWTQVPRWLIEGGATWVERATVFHSDFVKYEIERSRSNTTVLYRERPNATWLEDFLDPNYTSGWDKWNGNNYNPWAIYDVGSLVSEILVSISGPNSFLDLFKMTGIGKTFAQSFEYVYGIPWKDGARIIAEAIVAQQK